MRKAEAISPALRGLSGWQAASTALRAPSPRNPIDPDPNDTTTVRLNLGNTIQNNGAHGLEFFTGNFSGTVVSGNTITSNLGDGIALGAGIIPPVSGGNPAQGYSGTMSTSGPWLAWRVEMTDCQLVTSNGVNQFEAGGMPLAFELDSFLRILQFSKVNPSICSTT